MKIQFAIMACFVCSVFSGCNKQAALYSTQVPGNFPQPNLPDGYTGKWIIRLQGSDTVIQESTFQDGRFHGIQRWWYDNGQLKQEDSYLHGENDGRHAYWDKNGILLSEQWWRLGKQHGPCRTWHEGSPTQDGRFRDNKKNGRWIIHDWDGQLIADGTYDMGEPVTGTFIIQEGKGSRVDVYKDGVMIERGKQQ